MNDYLIVLHVVVQATHDVEAQKKAIPAGCELYDIKSIDQLDPWAARLKHYSMYRHPSRRNVLW